LILKLESHKVSFLFIFSTIEDDIGLVGSDAAFRSDDRQKPLLKNKRKLKEDGPKEQIRAEVKEVRRRVEAAQREREEAEC
jgi:hypothetical protein